MPKESLIVGDVVTLARDCMGNAPGVRAVVVELYDRSRYAVDEGLGVTLLFPDGRFDGFSPADRSIWGVRYVGHCPEVADYRFLSAVRLTWDFMRGRFGRVWLKES